MDEEIMFTDDVQEVETPEVEAPVVENSGIKIYDYIGKANIMSDLKEEEINCIYARCNEGYEKDFDSRRERNNTLIEANKMAMQILDPKSYPWKGCANVKLPIITTGAIDFASKIYPAVVQDDEVVRCKIIANGSEAQIKRMEAGERLATYLNWQ